MEYYSLRFHLFLPNQTDGTNWETSWTGIIIHLKINEYFSISLLERVCCFLHPGLCHDFSATERLYFHFLFFLRSLNLSCSLYFTFYSRKPSFHLLPACTQLWLWSASTVSYSPYHNIALLTMTWLMTSVSYKRITSLQERSLFILFLIIYHPWHNTLA